MAGQTLVGQVAAALVFGFLPLVGSGVSAVVGLYSWFVGAQVVGLWFRRVAEALAAVYRE